jgi:glutamyl-tRNA synthetase
MQFARAGRHAEVARAMLAKNQAYYCYSTPEELEAMRQKARAEGKPIRYDGTWRDRDPKEAPAGIRPVIRLRAPLDGETVVEDLVQGTVTVQNAQLDDMVLLRGDGTPTYMLAVVVDDHDMGITHVIRGDDHLNNTFRQIQVYRAMGWDIPRFAHIPLIHGADGAKLSKRHGALGVDAYRDMGFLPEALRNYLLRLGWGHGDDEIIPTEKAIEWFDLANVGRAASRFDMDKLTNLNAHYLRQMPDDELLPMVRPFLEKAIGGKLGEDLEQRVLRGLNGVKQRSRTLVELADNLKFYALRGTITLDAKAKALLTPDNKALLGALIPVLESASNWSEAVLEGAVKAFAEGRGVKLGSVAQPLRAALTGGTVSPGIFEVLAVLGRDDSLSRIKASE